MCRMLDVAGATTPTEIKMPQLGESVTEGTVTRWLKQEGDTVEVDEPLLEVSTDKVDTEIPAPTAGVLTKIVAHEDDTVEIGGELGVISEAGEAASSEPAPAAAPAPEPEPAPASEPEPAPAPEAARSADGHRLARRIRRDQPLQEYAAR